MSEITSTSVNLVTDASGKPAPQYIKPDGSGFAMVQGSNGAILSQSIGAPLSAAVTMQNAATTTGVGTSLPVNGNGVAVIAVATSASPAFNGTITFQGQGPDTNWYNVLGQLRSTGATSLTTTNSGLYEINCRGLQAIRANITAYSAGSVTIVGVTQALPSDVSTVQVAGTVPPLTAASPRTVGVLSSSQLSSTGNLNFRFARVLNRNARERTVLMYNNGLGTTVSGIHIYPYDSAMNPVPPNGNGLSYADFGSLNNNYWSVGVSEQSGTNAAILAAHVDSFEIVLNMSSVPSSGSLQIYVVELL